jgi:GNAT superfamily N-acetyltransferase
LSTIARNLPQDGEFTIRPAVIGDADAIGEMAREFNLYLRALGENSHFGLTPQRIRQDGFGAAPAFSGNIAEMGGAALGYLLYHPAYDSDLARRYLFVCDLFVREAGRRRGVGRALMEAAMVRCREIDGCGLLWSVFRPNRLATAFYRGLGAEIPADLDFMWWPAQV